MSFYSFYSISAIEERLIILGNMQYFVDQTGKDQVLVFPGMAPTTGGKGKSVYPVCMLHVQC